MPFSWLYKSKVYLIYSILISAISFIIGMICSRQLLALIMILVEITFAFSLYKENIGENRVKSKNLLEAIVLVLVVIFNKILVEHQSSYYHC